MNLADLQNSLQEAILKTETTVDQLKTFGENQNNVERLRVYRDAYYLRLIGCLKLKFEALQKYLGVAEFNQLAMKYLAQNPSQHYSIRFFGSALSVFIRKNYPELPIVAELAEFEWALCQALFPEPKEALNLEALQEISADHWSELIFRWHPSVALLQTQYPIGKLWSALQANESDSLVLEAVQPRSNYSYLIWSKQGLSYYLTLDSIEQKLFACIQHELQFDALCEAMSQSIPADKVVMWVSQHLQVWINHELLIL